MSGQLLKIDEATKRLSVSRYKLYELLREGQLLSVKVGPRGRRIPSSEVDRFIQENTVSGVSA